MEKLDLLIIRPGNQKELYGRLSKQCLTAVEPPVWAAILAAFVRQKGFSVKILDAEVYNWSHLDVVKKAKEIGPRLVQIVVSGTNPSASTWNMTGAGIAASLIKESAPEIPIVLSGLHPSALPERTMKDEKIDFVCQGEGFFTIPTLLKKISADDQTYSDIPGLWYREHKQIFSNPRPPVYDNLDDLPMPAWDLLPMKDYRAHNWHCMNTSCSREPYGVIYTSLGCPFNCTFCCINALFGKHMIRYRNPKNVITEIDYLVNIYGIKTFKILDEMFVLKPSHVRDFCNLVIERDYDLNFWAYARVDTVSKDILEIMKKAGINWLAYGFEAANEHVLKGVTKRYKKSNLDKSVRITRGAGINIIGNYIFGLPDDDMESMRQTLDLAKELNCEFANFYCCMAYPGSELYDDAVRQGIKLPKSWEGYSQLNEETFPLSTKHVSASEVLRFRDNAFKEYFSSPNYLKMIAGKFGESAVKSIKDMLRTEIKRKYA